MIFVVLQSNSITGLNPVSMNDTKIKTNKQHMKSKVNTGGNPYLNGLKFKSELPTALKKMKKYFGNFEKCGRKNIYLINNVHAFPFYIWITSAPSNLKFDSVLKGIMKQYGNYPIYVYFTREANTYPTTGGKTYWDAIKKVYNKGGSKFRGAIMGLQSLDANMAEEMMEHFRIKLDYRRYVDLVNGNVTMSQILKELGNVSSARLKVVLPLLQALNK